MATRHSVDLEHGGDEKLVELDEALNKLSQFDPRRAGVMEMRFFGSLNDEEMAELPKISTGSVKRDGKLARAWLLLELPA